MISGTFLFAFIYLSVYVLQLQTLHTAVAGIVRVWDKDISIPNRVCPLFLSKVMFLMISVLLQLGTVSLLPVDFFYEAVVFTVRVCVNITCQTSQCNICNEACVINDLSIIAGTFFLCHYQLFVIFCPLCIFVF